MSGTGSLMIRNLRKASDYDKARINQDDLLKIAIANDNNIANARRAYRQGDVPALTPQQQYTPDEVQADISKNYSDAITNLTSMGIDYREASQIVARLGADPSNLVILNNTFPSFKADFQKRFDVKRITITGFIDFFQKFREVFDESKGIADNSVLFNDKFDRIINNINDLRAILPTKDQIKGLSQSVKQQFRNAEDRGDRRMGIALRDIDDMFRRLARILPDEAVFQRIAALDPQRQFQELAQLQNRFDNLPSRDQVQRLLDRAPSLSADQFRQALEPLANSITDIQSATALTLTQSQQILDRVNAGASRDELRGMLANTAQIIIDGVENGASPEEIRQIIGQTIGTLPTKSQIQDLTKAMIDGQVGMGELTEILTNLASGMAQERQIKEREKRQTERPDLSNFPPLAMNVNINADGGIYDQVGLTLLRGKHPQIVFSQRGSNIQSRPYGKDALADLIGSSVALQQEVKRLTGENWINARTQGAKKALAEDFINKVELRIEEVEGRSPSMDTKRGEWETYDFSKPSRSTGRSRSESSSSTESNPRSPKPSGKGLENMVMSGRKPILIKKIGRGLEPVETPSHIQFGKYLLHANNMNKSVLSVHHKGGGRVQSIPVQSMSEDLRDFIVRVLFDKRTQKPDEISSRGGETPLQKEFSRLPLREQKLFEKMSKGAGVHHTLGLKPVKSDEDEKIEERFEVLKGEWFAGNNSHELVRELRKIVIYFMDEGRLTKSQARELLLTIN